MSRELAEELERVNEILTAIAGMGGRTLIAPSLGPDGDRAHQIGANKAFEQAADLARRASDILAALRAPRPAEPEAGVGGPVVSQVQMEDWSQGYAQPAPPVWRVELGAQVADFDHEQAARNWAAAIVAYAGNTADRLRPTLPPPAAGEALTALRAVMGLNSVQTLFEAAEEYPHGQEDVAAEIAALRLARAAMAQSATGDARAEALLPYDVTVGPVTFRKGVEWTAFVAAARRWYDAALAAQPPLEGAAVAELRAALAQGQTGDGRA